MFRMDPEQRFIPAIEREFGRENIIVVKDAVGGERIYRWCKDWKSSSGATRENSGDLYQRLITKVKMATNHQPISSITFVWMQGESDATGVFYADVYETSLMTLYAQLQQDLNWQDINWVIGRISDHDMRNSQFKRWTTIREIQVKVAESDSRFSWIDTDDLNDGITEPGRKKENDLHYSDSGYQLLGQRLADSAIKLIKLNSH